MNIEMLLSALRNSWGPDTCQGEWDESNPAKGQCCVSSLVIKQFFSGELIRAIMNEGTVHYWNQLPSGVWIDSTRSQFPTKVIPITVTVRPNPELWAFRETWDKYEILKERVLARSW